MPVNLRLPKACFVTLGLTVALFGVWRPALAAEVAPRISDRELVERLVRVEEGLKALRKEMETRFDALQRETNARFAAIDKRFDDLNRRIDMVLWMQGVWVTATMVVLGFVVRVQWQMSRRQAQMEATLEAHRDELALLRDLMAKFLPPRGAP